MSRLTAGPPPQRMTDSPPPRSLEESVVLTVYPQEPLTVDRVLRRLELLRKRLSVRWCGLDGSFAGYDRLNVGDLSGIVDGTVLLEARLVNADETSHVIEFVATRPADPSSTQPTSHGQVLVHGIGRALQTPRAVKSD